MFAPSAYFYRPLWGWLFDMGLEAFLKLLYELFVSVLLYWLAWGMDGWLCVRRNLSVALCVLWVY